MALEQSIVLDSLTAIGLGRMENKERDLEGECLWVPASVKHHVAKNSSLFIYGGVRVLPKVNVINSSDPRHRQVMNNFFNTKGIASINSASLGASGNKYASKQLPSRLSSTSITPIFDQIKSFSVKEELDGAFYPKEKLTVLVKYLEKRGVNVYGTDRSPCFRGVRNGPSQIYLPENPTVLQVKHELSHWLDFKQLGFDNYAKLSTYQRAKLVLERLQGNRIWESLNKFEK